MDWNELRDIIWKYTKSLLSEHPLIVMAGAHHGEVCIDKCKKYFPTAKIHAFEPCVSSYDICKKKIPTDLDITLYNKGLSSKNETRQLNLSFASNTNSLYKVNLQNLTSRQTKETETIELITLDEWYISKFGDIDLLYLNIEGHELEALKGGLNILSKVKVIFVELNVAEIWKNTPLDGDMDKFLRENNFSLILHDKRACYSWTAFQYLGVYTNNNLLKMSSS
jgi:FkbM family methyltransferase